MSHHTISMGTGNFKELRLRRSTSIPIIEVGQFFTSSKTCYRCGQEKEDLTLSIRTCHCGQCDMYIDRDVNAAINLKNFAIGHTETENTCGVQVRPHSQARETEAGKVSVWQQQLLPVEELRIPMF